MPNHSAAWWDAKKARDEAKRKLEQYPYSSGYRRDYEGRVQKARQEGVRDSE